MNAGTDMLCLKVCVARACQLLLSSTQLLPPLLSTTAKLPLPTAQTSLPLSSVVDREGVEEASLLDGACWAMVRK